MRHLESNLEIALLRQRTSSRPAIGASTAPLTAAPYALYSQVAPWDAITDMPAGFADGVDDVDDADAGPANELEMPPSCASGQLTEWDGSAWACAEDDEDSDADPAYELNQGLALVSNTLVITDAGGALGTDLSVYQQRVSGSCTVGSTVRAINTDGSVVCEAHDTRPVYSLTTLDSTGSVGRETSITVGTDGLGLISYRDSTNGDLKVAHCDNVACTNATVSTLDNTGNVGFSTSITVGTDGLGLISHYDYTNSALKVAHCSNVFCVPYWARE
ncbi:MAG: hypothetical protein JXA37_09385 [Chloroflexia bacterium]|nr:hypothetical protein [Chloroflexia bacterium]